METMPRARAPGRRAVLGLTWQDLVEDKNAETRDLPRSKPRLQPGRETAVWDWQQKHKPKYVVLCRGS